MAIPWGKVAQVAKLAYVLFLKGKTIIIGKFKVTLPQQGQGPGSMGGGIHQ